MKTTDIMIIGGGVIGSACAWFASSLEVNVTLLEREEIGSSAATGVSKGLLRVYEPMEELADLASKGLDFYRNWPDELGRPVTTHKGLLYRVKGQNVEYAKYFCEAYSSEDYPIKFVTFSEVSHISPELNWADDDYVIYEPNGGFGNPKLTAQKFIAGAQNRGVSVKERCCVSGINQAEDGRWVIQSNSETWMADKLIIATGAWASDWFPDFGISPRTIAIPHFETSVGLNVPVIDEVSLTYMRPLDQHRFVVGSQIYDFMQDALINERTVSAEQVSDSQSRVDEIIENARPCENQANSLGMDGYTQNLLPIIDFEVTRENLIILTGFSGRGYKLAPAVGRSCFEHLSQTLAMSEQGAI